MHAEYLRSFTVYTALNNSVISNAGPDHALVPEDIGLGIE